MKTEHTYEHKYERILKNMKILNMFMTFNYCGWSNRTLEHGKN